MRTIAAPLKAAMQAGTSTLARIWKITRKDGTILRFTDNDQDVVISGDGTYLSTNSFSITNITTTLTRGAGQATVQVVLSDDANSISFSDIRAGKYDRADFILSWLDYTDPSLGKVDILAGFLGPYTSNNEGTVGFDVLGRLAAALQGVGLKYLPECRHDFGDTACGLTITDYSATGTVSVVVFNNRKFRCTLSGTPADYQFSFGTLLWTSGSNNGLYQEVIQQAEFDATYDDILLSLNMPYDIQLGDTFTIYQGCDKTPTACKAYSNFANFGGFPFVPGQNLNDL